MMAYNQLSGLNMQIVAVTFPPHYSIKLSDGTKFFPVIPDKVKKFFAGVEIPIITSRLPFDEIEGVELQNKEMAALRNSIAIFGGSMPLAVQAVLQATDHGLLEIGDEVIAVTADTAVLITASTTQRFLNKECGLMVNEIICKPRNFTVSRPLQGKGSSIELKGKLEKASIELAETSRHGPGQS
jgi:hypothetical protein